MIRDVHRAILVVLLALAAGCSGALVDGTPSPSVSPAPVPSETVTPRAAIPGVSDGKLTDPAALVASHRAALEGRSYTRIRTVRATSDGELRWELRVESRVAPDGRVHAVILPAGPELPPTLRPGTTRVERYVGEHRTWVAVWRDGERRVRQYPERFAVGRPQLYPVLGSLRVEVAGRAVGENATRYRLAGRGVRDRELLSTAARHGRAAMPSLSATVTDRGVVRSYRFTYWSTDPPAVSEQRYRVEFRITDVGRTETSVPSWVPEAAATDG